MSHTPACVGIILDGNRRWAKQQGLPSLEGHRRGLEKISECVRWVRERGIPHVALYALSTENLHRSKEEVAHFMDLAIEAAGRALSELGKENVRIRFVGNLDLVTPKVREAAHKAQQESAHNTGTTVWVCFAYGSRAEILAAAQAAAASGVPINEESFRGYMWSAGMPDPDIIIRPGGEKRLSNFLLWQAAYSELFFLDVYWPDFAEADLDAVLTQYAGRNRRNGR